MHWEAKLQVKSRTRCSGRRISLRRSGICLGLLLRLSLFGSAWLLVLSLERNDAKEPRTGLRRPRPWCYIRGGCVQWSQLEALGLTADWVHKKDGRLLHCCCSWNGHRSTANRLDQGSQRQHGPTETRRSDAPESTGRYSAVDRLSVLPSADRDTTREEAAGAAANVSRSPASRRGATVDCPCTD